MSEVPRVDILLTVAITIRHVSTFVADNIALRALFFLEKRMVVVFFFTFLAVHSHLFILYDSAMVYVMTQFNPVVVSESFDTSLITNSSNSCYSAVGMSLRLKLFFVLLILTSSFIIPQFCDLSFS
jgi:hypothetical protein